MSKKKNVLYTYMESLGDYFPAQAVKCDVCGKVFKVKRGFTLVDDFITCVDCIPEFKTAHVEKLLL